MAKKLLILVILLLVLFLFLGCSITGKSNFAPPVSESRSDEKSAPPAVRATKYVSVKYRDNPVDIAAPYFEYLDTAGSSFIRGAWYDQGNQYMVISLDGVYYHYCGLPLSVWNNFKKAESFGKFYNQNIKERYDCRQGYVPNY